MGFLFKKIAYNLCTGKFFPSFSLFLSSYLIKECFMDERALIKQAQKGDSRAFELLVGTYYEVMFKMAYKWVGHREAAEDITQEACMKLARSIDQFRFESAFTSWLYRLVVNCAKDWVKSQGRHTDKKTVLEDQYDLKAEGVNAEKQLYIIEMLSLLDDLPDGLKETLVLVHGEGMSHKEASKILGVKESTISWRIHEARKLMDDMVVSDEGGKVGAI